MLSRSLFALAALAASAALAAPTTLVLSSTAKIDPFLIANKHDRGMLSAWVHIGNATDPRNIVKGHKFASKTAKTNYLVGSLKKTANETQGPVMAYLEKNHDNHFRSFWINNFVYVREATFELLEGLAALPQVSKVSRDHIIPLHEPISRMNRSKTHSTLEWGIKKISADKVWAKGNQGAGVVVANIDTGVRYTHESLIGSYRGSDGSNAVSHDYNWFSPTELSSEPNDGNGHGTHTMGTIAGSHGIGVAPKSKWIACKGCGFFGCSEYDLTTCAEWMTCPTKTDGSDEDCSKAPDVINNSWGGGQGDTWYDVYMEAWIAAGIVPVFSEGNSGPNCGTANSPGDSRLNIGVGATDENDALAYFSSRGPGVSASLDDLQPDVSAPGYDIRSAASAADDEYVTMSGTSMASPHVTGAIALMLSGATKSAAIFNAPFAVSEKALEDTSSEDLPKPQDGAEECGGVKYNTFPNFFYGKGRINAEKAVEYVAK